MTKLYVVAFDDDVDAEKLVWTVSPSPHLAGWETDSGYPGYGLSKAVAEEIVRRVNAAGEFPPDLRASWREWL